LTLKRNQQYLQWNDEDLVFSNINSSRNPRLALHICIIFISFFSQSDYIQFIIPTMAVRPMIKAFLIAILTPRIEKSALFEILMRVKIKLWMLIIYHPNK
jgi:hypothetical protein